MGDYSSQIMPPCKSCPWRKDSRAADIPNFDMSLAERLATTCPDKRGMGPDFSAALFACHQTIQGKEIHCAGWLAQVGARHPLVRLAIVQGRLDPQALRPQPGWPQLHASYPGAAREVANNGSGSPGRS